MNKPDDTQVNQAFDAFMEEKFKKAIVLYEGILKQTPEDVNIAISLAFCYVSDLQHNNALLLFSALHKNHPNNPDILNGIGLCYHALEQYDNALKYYDQAMQTAPEYTNTYFNKSEVFIDMGLPEEAIKCFDRYLQLVPDNEIAMNNRAYTLLQMEQYEQAIEAFTEIIKIKPNYPNPYFHRANAWFNENMVFQALFDMRRAALLGHPKATSVLRKKEFKHKRHLLVNAMLFVKDEGFATSLGKALKNKDFEKIYSQFSDAGLPFPENTFWMDHFIHDGMTYDGLELYSISPDALKEEPFYSLPSLLPKNIEFHERYTGWELYSPAFILLGQLDEELIIYDTESTFYIHVAREDLMPYNTYPSIEKLLSALWQTELERFTEDDLRYKLINDIEESLVLFGFRDTILDKLSEALHKEIENEVNIIKKIPITIGKIYISHDLSAVMELSEPRHVYLNELTVHIDLSSNKPHIKWHIENNGDNGILDATAYFSTKELKDMLGYYTLTSNKKELALYTLKAGRQFLHLNSSGPWKDPFATPDIKYKKALAFFEKATLLNEACKPYVKSLKTLLEII